MINRFIWPRFWGVAALSLTLAACSGLDHQRQMRPDPDERLDQMLILYNIEADKNGSCQEIWRAGYKTIDCDRILREVERLQVEFPNHPRIIMASAVMGYERGNAQKAQILLDQLLAQHGEHVEAAILRCHIALEEGNARLCNDLLQRQIMLAPDHPHLRETMAMTQFALGNFQGARSALGMAGRLGAPAWRIAYHHGVICESEMKWEQACRFYNEALEQKPDYRPALARLSGLVEFVECATPQRASAKDWTDRANRSKTAVEPASNFLHNNADRLRTQAPVKPEP